MARLIQEKIKKPLAESGLSYRWEVKQEKGSVKAICIITHKLGHSESSDFDVGSDNDAYMTAPQKLASALTFAKRYSLCNALGISTGDEDTDATDVKKEPEALSAKSKIVFRLRALGYKADTKEQIEEAVKKLTGLGINDKVEVAARLQVIIEQKNESNEIQ